MLSQSPSCSVHPLSLRRAPLVGRGLCSSLLVLLALGAVSNSWAGNCNIVVGSTADTGGNCTVYPNAPDASCTLRQAISTATADQTICFSADMKGKTITLSSELVFNSDPDNPDYPLTANNITIQGHDIITISGGNLVRIFNVSTSTKANFSGLRLVNGRASASNGGAITADASSTVTISNSTFENNYSGVKGGAIFIGAGSMTINNSTFKNNGSAETGGAIYATGSLNVNNSTFNVNYGSAGGGIYGEQGGYVRVTNSTLSNNKYTALSPDGFAGAIYFGAPSSSRLRNSIVANSTDESENPAPDCAVKDGAALSSNLNNLIENDDGARSCLTLGLSNVVGSDPALSTLANNGGPTQTMAISSSSPAYNAGSNNYCVLSNANDQRGVTRPQYSTCDIGSYEASAKAGGGKLTLVKKGQCITSCSGDTGFSADSTYPQLSLKGVCWAYVNLRNNTSSPSRTLTNITTELVSVTNNNWVLNTDTIPMQGGAAVLVGNPSVTCTDAGIPTPTGTASSLAFGQTINVWYKVGMMNAGPYSLTTRLFATDPNATAMSFGSNNLGRPVANEELGEFTVDFNSEEEVSNEETILPILSPIVNPIDGGFLKRVLGK